MNQTEFLRSLEERPLRMAVQRDLPRPQINLRPVTAPSRAPDTSLPAIIIVGLAFWLVYAIMRTIPA